MTKYERLKYEHLKEAFKDCLKEEEIIAYHELLLNSATKDLDHLTMGLSFMFHKHLRLLPDDDNYKTLVAIWSKYYKRVKAIYESNEQLNEQLQVIFKKAHNEKMIWVYSRLLSLATSLKDLKSLHDNTLPKHFRLLPDDYRELTKIWTLNHVDVAMNKIRSNNRLDLLCLLLEYIYITFIEVEPSYNGSFAPGEGAFDSYERIRFDQGFLLIGDIGLCYYYAYALNAGREPMKISCNDVDYIFQTKEDYEMVVINHGTPEEWLQFKPHISVNIDKMCSWQLSLFVDREEKQIGIYVFYAIEFLNEPKTTEMLKTMPKDGKIFQHGDLVFKQGTVAYLYTFNLNDFRSFLTKETIGEFVPLLIKAGLFPPPKKSFYEKMKKNLRNLLVKEKPRETDVWLAKNGLYEQAIKTLKKLGLTVKNNWERAPAIT
ncbi:hypothetical protein HOE31_02985 [bacterium]|jgi:hypothetical protein|nr:hypothetical protein [bacterium]MBT4763739.1 hypothetical protein [bacterium]MBT5401109.1 hypothetical protein [bacterium]MBT5942930.1 hypothetical protein [bacterium]MBT6067574.1 hypothetical protein [bacterium]